MLLSLPGPLGHSPQAQDSTKRRCVQKAPPPRVLGLPMPGLSLCTWRGRGRRAVRPQSGSCPRPDTAKLQSVGDGAPGLRPQLQGRAKRNFLSLYARNLRLCPFLPIHSPGHHPVPAGDPGEEESKGKLLLPRTGLGRLSKRQGKTRGGKRKRRQREKGQQASSRRPRASNTPSRKRNGGFFKAR